MGIFTLVMIFGSVGYVFWAAFDRAKNRRTMFSSVAQQLDLDVDLNRGLVRGFFSAPRLYGEYKGVQVSVTIKVHHFEEEQTTYVRFEAMPAAPLPAGLWICTEGLASKITKLFGSQDIELGDKYLDDALVIKGDDEAEVLEWFGQEGVDVALTNLLTIGEQATVRDREGVVLLVSDDQQSSVELIRKLDAVVDVARHMGGAPKRTPRSDAPEQISLTPVDVRPAAKPVAELTVAPVITGARTPPCDPEVDACLLRLADPDLGYQERGELLSQLRDATLSVEVQVQAVEYSRALSLDAAFRNGRTVVGQVGPCQVRVAFPKARDLELEELKSESSICVQVKMLSWDSLNRRAIMQVV
jgi:hypothetical protein